MTFALVKNTYPARLPLYFCIVSFGLDAFLALGFFWPSACFWQGVGTQYCAVSCLVFWLATSYNMYAVALGRPYMHLERMFVALGFGAPVPLTAIPWALNLFQLPTDRDPAVACWLKPHEGSRWPAYVFLYAWMTVACLCGLFWWVQTLRQIYRLHVLSRSPGTSEATLLVVNKDDSTPSVLVIMQLYSRHLLFVFTFIVVFGVLLAFELTYDLSTVSYPFMVIHAVFLCGTLARLEGQLIVGAAGTNRVVGGVWKLIIWVGGGGCVFACHSYAQALESKTFSCFSCLAVILSCGATIYGRHAQTTAPVPLALITARAPPHEHNRDSEFS
jgi:hypothetical protein